MLEFLKRIICKNLNLLLIKAKMNQGQAIFLFDNLNFILLFTNKMLMLQRILMITE